MLCCRFWRLRPVSFLLPAFVFTWMGLTYYLAFYKAGIVPIMLDSDRRIADELSSKIDQVEQIINEQLKENNQLLNVVKESIHGTTPVDIKFESGTTKSIDYTKARIAVLVIACNRPSALKNLLDQLLRLRPAAEQFPLIVSQDCFHEETQNTAKSYGSQVTYLKHPDNTDITLPVKTKKFLGYYKLARHYKWALNQTFYNLGHDSVIIVEDDLDLAVDFFDYFLAGNKLLKLDPTLWCVSAWNDHGKTELIDLEKPELLYRTDFFGGLGWLLQKDLWQELEPNWPITFWDDWMRHPDRRKNRACIRPEVSRTSMSLHGKVGVSKGLYFDKHLKFIRLNDKYVNFSKMDVSYLLKDNYDEPFVKRVYGETKLLNDWSELEKMTKDYEDSKAPPPSAVRFTYTDQSSYKTLAKSGRIMEDAKAGVGRMAYRGVVTFMYKQTRVYLAPPAGWTQYDASWT